MTWGGKRAPRKGGLGGVFNGAMVFPNATGFALRYSAGMLSAQTKSRGSSNAAPLRSIFAVVFLLVCICGVNAFPAQPGPFVYVCQDGGNGGYEAFPDVCRLKDGRLACVFYAGWTHVSLPDVTHPKGGRIVAVYSADEGRTWSMPEVVYDGPNDDRDSSIAQLADGAVVCNFFSLESDSKGGYTGLGSWLVESRDGGKTWSDARRIVADYYCSSPIREIAPGDLVLGLYRENAQDANGAVTLSKDNGTTWSTPIDIPNGGLRLDAETDFVKLNDGRLYAAQRTEKESMRYSISADGGSTWSVSAPIGFPGHSPYLHRAPDGILLLAHRLPQTSLHYSLDDAATWSENVLVDDVIGAYPSMVTLKDGSILIVYYEEGGGSKIRARKFRATSTGIEWLTW